MVNRADSFAGVWWIPESMVCNSFVKEKFQLSTNEQSGFLFNMSVGYDLEGIKTKKIDDFIEQLKNAKFKSFI